MAKSGPLPTIETDVAQLTIPEEGTATIKVRLTAEPARDAVLTVSVSGDPDITLRFLAQFPNTSSHRYPQTRFLKPTQWLSRFAVDQR